MKGVTRPAQESLRSKQRAVRASWNERREKRDFVIKLARGLVHFFFLGAVRVRAYARERAGVCMSACAIIFSARRRSQVVKFVYHFFFCVRGLRAEEFRRHQ